MPIRVESYKCDWCPKTLRSFAAAVKHEKNCIKNPGVKACVTCLHYTYTRDYEYMCLTEYHKCGLNVTGIPKTHCGKWEGKK